MAKRTLNAQEQLSDIPSQEAAHTLSRKSQVGRIYVRASTPSSSKKTPKPPGTDQESSFYKWRPQIEEREREVSAFQAEGLGKAPSATMSPELKGKSNNYRVKHKNTKSIVEQKLALPFEDRQSSKKKFKTEKVLSDNQEEGPLNRDKTGKDKTAKDKSMKDKTILEKAKKTEQPQ